MRRKVPLVRTTTLFGLHVLAVMSVILSLGWMTIYGLQKSRWWDARSQLALESYGLHLRLEADMFRLFKEYGDALLIGDRDGGAGERELRLRIDGTLDAIRDVIAREIQMVGEEEIEELALLDEIEASIREVNASLARLAASGVTGPELQELADLLDQKIDIQLTGQIDAALEEEREEVEEVIADAEAFRARNERMVYALLLTALGILATSLVSFNAHVRKPLMRLRDSLSRLRTADYSGSVDLGGAAEFRDLGQVLGDMAAGLSRREAGREEQRQQLEDTVARRTAELQRMISRLEKGDENRKRLMADISHELRTPLTIILGEAEVALRTNRGIGNDLSDALARIRDSARHTNQIVDDMLTVARQEAGQLRLDRRETDLRKVMRDAVEMFPQPVEVDMPSEPVLLSVDAVRIRQSVLALLQNARRYGGPRIGASLETQAGSVVLTVEDDGPGLSDAEKRDAFERFFRGSNASGQGLEGSGLGLPVVKSIVEAHGGQVTLTDSALGGLLVRIELPRSAPLRIVGPDRSARSA